MEEQTSSIKLTPEIRFCLQFLKKNNISDGTVFTSCLSKVKEDTQKFVLVPVVDSTFFTDLASKMREMWPPGKKDNKWDWRDSVKNLAARLEWLWGERNLNRYTIDDCLIVCRKYLSEYSGSKYMKLLKYFICKYGEISGANLKTGKVSYSYESEFANMLEALTDEERIAEQQAAAIEAQASDFGGTLL